MVWTSSKARPTMGKSNEGMWNSSTHAMSDISALAYRRNVPACEVIVPAEEGASEDTFEPRDQIFQSSFADVSWNKVGCGRGRGALLLNRDVLHRNDQELKKQLRIANGLGYGNDLIEARFQNSSLPLSHDGDSVGPVNFYDDDDLSLSPSRNKDKCSTETSSEEEVTTSSKKTEEEDEEDDDDVSVNENGEWNWEKRTATPPPNRVILRNVALESLKRKQQKVSAKSAEKNVSPQVAPIEPGRDECTSLAWAMPKVKEDWRAEIRAAEEARQVEEVGTGTAKAKKGWRSEVGEPLLGGFQIESNWSVFAPNVSPPLRAAEDNYFHKVPAPELGHQTVVESPPMGLVESGGLDVLQRTKRNKKKKGQNVRIMYVPPAERTYPEPSVGPAGYLMPINGVSPMAIRNSEYNPLVGQNIHRTFGNVFSQTIKQLKTNADVVRKPYKKTGDGFSLSSEEFPQLK